MSSTVAPPETAAARAQTDRQGPLGPVWPLVVLGVAMVVAAGLILHLTAGFTFYYDEWNFLMNRQPFTADALLAPHNEHNVMVTVLLFKALWAIAGLAHYWTFRVLVVVLHLLTAGMLYVYGRRRVGAWMALAPAVAVLFLGTAWEIILWPFEVQFLIPIAAGLGAFLALERRDVRGDLMACGLLILAFSSGSLGIPVAAGVGVELLFGPDRLRRLLRVMVLPVVLYLVWLQQYDPFRHRFGTYGSVPKFVYDELGSALAGLAGFRFDSVRAPALVAAGLLLVFLAERFFRGRVNRSRMAAIAVMALAYWSALALYRPWVADQEPSRYLYGGAVFVLLALLEVARGHRFGPRALAAVAAVVLLCAASGLDDLRDGATTLRAYSDYVEPGLGALELTRGHVSPGFHPEPTRAPDIVAGRYFQAVDRWGSPADTPAQILARDEGAREAADVVLVHALRLHLARGPAPATAGPAPAVVADPAGAARVTAGCLRFNPGTLAAVDVRLPPGGAVVTASGAPVVIQLRRFADGFLADGAVPGAEVFANDRQAFGRALLRGVAFQLSDGSRRVLRIPADRAAAIPWQARFSSAARVTVCGLPAGWAHAVSLTPGRWRPCARSPRSGSSCA